MVGHLRKEKDVVRQAAPGRSCKRRKEGRAFPACRKVYFCHSIPTR